jgi:hypothetical protein
MRLSSAGVAMVRRAHERGLALRFIESGERDAERVHRIFNGGLRDECLNENWFTSLAHSQAIIEAWPR